MNSDQLRHRHVDAGGLAIHVVERGPADSPVVFFLHGWPQNWSVYETVMQRLVPRLHVVAIDLPGIGESTAPPPANDKRTLAGYVSAVIERLGLRQVTRSGTMSVDRSSTPFSKPTRPCCVARLSSMW